MPIKSKVFIQTLQNSQDRHKISFAFEFNDKNTKKVFGANLPPNTIKLDLPPNTIRVKSKPLPEPTLISILNFFSRYKGPYILDINTLLLFRSINLDVQIGPGYNI